MGGNKKRKKKLRRGLLKFFRRRNSKNYQPQQDNQQPIYIQPTYSPVSQGGFSHARSSYDSSAIMNYFMKKRVSAQPQPAQQPAPQPVRHQPQQPAPQPVQQPAPQQRRGIHPLDLQRFSKKKSSDKASENASEKISNLSSVENWITLFDKFKDDPTARRIYFSAKKGDFELAINNYNMFDISRNFLLQDLYLAFASGKEFRTAEVLKDASESDELIYSYKTKHSKNKLPKKDSKFLSSELPTNANDNFVLENLTDSINIAKLLLVASINCADYIELTLNDDSNVRINLNLHRNSDGSIDHSKTRIELNDLMILLSNASSTKSINLFELSADPAVDDTIISTIDIETLPKDKIVIPKGVKIAGATILITGVLALGSLGLYQAFNGEQEVIDTQPIPDTSTSQNVNVDANSQQTPSSTDSKDFFELMVNFRENMAEAINFAKNFAEAYKKACDTELTDPTDEEIKEIIDCVCKGACEWCHGEQQEETQTPSEEGTTETPEQDTNDSEPSCKPVKPPCKPVDPPSKPVKPPCKPVVPPSKPIDPPCKPVDPPSNEPTTEEEYVVDKVIGNVGKNENNSGVTPGVPNNEPTTVPKEKPDCEPSQPSQPSQPNTPGLPNEDNTPVIPPSEDGPTLIPGENTGCDTSPENPPTDNNTPNTPPTDENTPDTPPTGENENEHVVPDFTFPSEPNIPNNTGEDIKDQPRVNPPSYSCDTPNEQNTPFEIESNRPSVDSSESGSSRNGGGNGSSAMDYFHSAYGNHEASGGKQIGSDGQSFDHGNSNGNSAGQSSDQGYSNVVDDFAFDFSA